MIKGILCALAACLIWGLSFVVPVFMEDFSSVEITLGRYLFYGIASSFLLLKSIHRVKYPIRTWLHAAFLGFLGSLGYYPFIVLSLRYANPAICALISGITPIAIAFYGNWIKRETSFSNLIVPSLIILAGLVMINLPYISFEDSNVSHLLGVAFAFISLASWTKYAVSNAYFLKANPHIHYGDWTTLIGFTTLLWMSVTIPLTYVFFNDLLPIERYTYWSPELGSFLIGCAMLGIVCSWLANYLWNIASANLPLLITSQLLIFETLFGLLFAYLVEWRLPYLMETLGTMLLVTAIAYGLRAFAAPHSDTVAS